MNLPKSLEKAINEFAKLPGIGPKSAQRLVFYLLKRQPVELDIFAENLIRLKDGVLYCQQCHIMTDKPVCTTCSDSSRDHSLLCVVEDSLDAIALDRAGNYRGLFHVLGGVLNPMEGVGPEKLNIGSLESRVTSYELGIQEVIIATNPTLEGETTAMYLSRLLREKSPEVKLTRIARGLPTGGAVEYADELTLTRALEGRREY